LLTAQFTPQDKINKNQAFTPHLLYSSCSESLDLI